jgi:hypothetical protein
MAQFDNVTYTHYHDDLGRTIVPDADTFDQYKLENVLFCKSLLNDNLIAEREPGGIDDACCMMIEETYTAAQTESGAAGAGGFMTSESIGGYSYSKSAKAAEIAIEKNAKSVDAKKYKWLELYCDVLNGWR